MHVLVWAVADERYAVASRSIVEVVAVVEPRRVARCPEWLSGLMNYRGSLIPMIDARALMDRGRTDLRRASRVLVMRVAGGQGREELIGLIVEAVEAVERHDFQAGGSHPGLASPEAPFLGPVALTDDGPIQLVDVERLLQEEHRAMLFEHAGETEA